MKTDRTKQRQPKLDVPFESYARVANLVVMARIEKVVNLQHVALKKNCLQTKSPPHGLSIWSWWGSPNTKSLHNRITTSAFIGCSVASQGYLPCPGASSFSLPDTVSGDHHRIVCIVVIVRFLNPVRYDVRWLRGAISDARLFIGYINSCRVKVPFTTFTGCVCSYRDARKS